MGEGKSISIERKRGKELKQWFAAAPFVLPALMFFLVFFSYPILMNIYLTFHSMKPAGGQLPIVWVGLGNLRRLFGDPIFWRSLWHSLQWAMIGMGIEVSLGFVTALLLWARIRGWRSFRIIWFIPILLSGVIVGTMWRWLLQPDFGLINVVLRAVGLGGLARPWLGSTAYSLYVLIGVSIWQTFGFNMVILLASLSSIPQDILDAAKIDGVSWWQNINYILIPLMRRVIITLLILAYLGKMQIYDIVYATTMGGPNWATSTINYYMISKIMSPHPREIDFAYPATIAVVLLVILLTTVALFNLLLQRRRAVEY